MTPLEDLCKALQLTGSNNDAHADTIRRVLNTPGFDVNRLDGWNERLKNNRVALHVACGYVPIWSHFGAQLLISDERCDVNLQDKYGHTALMTAVKHVRSEDDKHAKIIGLLLAHLQIEINKHDRSGETALHKACGHGI